jgi:four helix bundle protein
MRLATKAGMGVKRLEDLVAYQLAVEFKKQVYALVRANAEANRDFRYRSQLFEAVASVEANLAEGWRRFGAGEMAQFIRFGLASLEESKRRLKDGVHRGYFTDEQCESVLVPGNRCGAAMMALWRSLQPFTSHPPRKPR